MLILSYENEFNLHVKEISFSYERMSTKTRFEEEAKGNSVMAYLVNPRKPPNKSFAELVDLVKNLLNPGPSSIVYRFKFNSRFRQRGETIQQYVSELRNLSEYCEFGDQFEKMPHDRLVCAE